jgi:hypothetical protein
MHIPTSYNFLSRLLYNATGGLILAGNALTVFMGDWVEKANAGYSGRIFDGFALRDIPDAQQGAVVYAGFISVPSAQQHGNPWAVGNRIFVSAAYSGEYTNVPPVTAGYWIVPVGIVHLVSVGYALVLIDKQPVIQVF